ncbi:hypothetical protein GUJ93_ZPchr0007g4103 [Zizania palustris]|uniref:Thioredoxin domain-containing protein n=1 Tax=Zizania palustris TaxID=103762 RepID=A0A8J5TK05_ZIZPA|nr:hypothetical protein GUJ93_ZPchr0007g4103 [Zizania palustris]
MGCVLSSKRAAGEKQGESAVVAVVHSKARWDELWDAHNTTNKLVIISSISLRLNMTYGAKIINLVSFLLISCFVRGNQIESKAVIDFSASWCQPCKMIEPAFKEMAARFTDAVFLKIDVDELAEVARTWRVQAMPTFVLARGGEEVSRVVGADMDELERTINMFTSMPLPAQPPPPPPSHY